MNKEKTFTAQADTVEPKTKDMCFWPSGCSDSRRCCEFGSCVAAYQNKHKHEIFDTQASDKEKLAQWMMGHGFATGHGDTVDDLLVELGWQIDELRRTTAQADGGLAGGLLDSLKRIADMKDRDGNSIEMTAQELQGIARRAIACHENAGPSHSGWIPVSERLPPEEKNFWSWSPVFGYQVSMCSSNPENSNGLPPLEKLQIELWMEIEPLPSSPEVKP